MDEGQTTTYARGNLGPDSVDARDLPFFSPQDIDRIISGTHLGARAATTTPSATTTKPLVKLPNLPPVYDQRKIGSCVSNAVLAALRYAEFKHGVKYDAFQPSRMFLYRNARLRLNPADYGKNRTVFNMDDQLKIDTGGLNRTNIVSLLMDGVCTEDLWPYERATVTKGKDSNGDEVDIFSNILVKPNPVEPKDLGAAQFQAKNSSHPQDPKSFSGQKDNIPRAISYYRIYDPRKQEDVDVMARGIWQFITQPAIALLEETIRQGWPFIFGMAWENTVNLSNSVTNGVLDDPPANFATQEAHTMLAVGFDSDKKRFLVQNSWGKAWPEGVGGGRVWIPYAYFSGSYESKSLKTGKVWQLPITYDFWVIKTSEVARLRMVYECTVVQYQESP